MRYRLMATYQGVPYEAGAGPAGTDVVLFAACPPPEELGFEPAPGHWRKRVTRTEIDALWESRPVGIFRGEPCIVLDDLGDRLHIAYLGTDPGRAALLGYWQVDRGVFELLAPRDEVTGLAEERVERPLHGDSAVPQPGTPAYPYGTAPWPASPGSPGPAAGPPPPVPPAPGLGEWRPPVADPLLSGNGTASAPHPPGYVNGSSRPAPDPLGRPGEYPAAVPPPSGPADLPAAGPADLPAAGLPAAGLPPARFPPAGLPAADLPAPGVRPEHGPAGPFPPGHGGPGREGSPLGDAGLPRPDHPVPAEPGPLDPPPGWPVPPAGQPGNGPQPAGLPPYPPGPYPPQGLWENGQGQAVPPPREHTGSHAVPLARAMAAGQAAAMTAAQPGHPDGPVPGSPGHQPPLPPAAAAGLAGPPQPGGPAWDGPAPPAGSVPLNGAGSPAGPAATPAGAAAAGAAYPPAGQRRERRGRSARRQRVTTRAIFCELADLAAIPRHAYALEEETDGAMCLLPAEGGYEVFLAVEGARHEVRTFTDEEAAYFYLFGVLVAEAIRNGALASR